MLSDERVVPGLVRNNLDVGDVAFVAGARVSKFAELHRQVTSYVTLVLTSERGNSVDTTAIT